MKKIMLGICGVAMILSLSACSGAFWGGLGGGTVATGAGYEINAAAKMAQLNKDVAAGKMNQTEYDIRKDQIKKMAVFQ